MGREETGPPSSGERGAVPRGQAWRARTVLGDRDVRENAVLRHESEPKPRPLVGRQRSQGRPSKAIAGGAGRREAAFSKVDLPAPLRPGRAALQPGSRS